MACVIKNYGTRKKQECAGMIARYHLGRKSSLVQHAVVQWPESTINTLHLVLSGGGVKSGLAISYLLTLQMDQSRREISEQTITRDFAHLISLLCCLNLTKLLSTTKEFL